MRSELAAELATEIDRLALCIHQPTGRRPDLMAALAPLGMPRQSIVAVAARFLAAGRLAFADLASMSRYEAEADLRRLLGSHIRRGLLVDEGGDGFVPSPAFQSAARLVLQLQGEEAARLWSAASLPATVELASAHVEAALGSDLALDAFRRQVGVHHTAPSTDAGQLLARVTELRYLRSDIHVRCLADEGLSGPSARALHRLWRGVTPRGDIDPALIRAGLVDVEGDTHVTTRGADACARIEVSTNGLFASLFVSLDEARSSDLLDRMRSLDGEDPRPVDDR